MVLTQTPNFEPLRVQMVQRLRHLGIVDAQVLSIMQQVPRHVFVDSALWSHAYEETSLPIGLEQTISKPNVVARMVELLLQNPCVKQGRVLEIGSGCGYQSLILSYLVKEVYSLERLSVLHAKARNNVRNFRRPNLHLIMGDGMLGFPKGAPYSGIISAAAGESLPQTWIEQLAIGGRLVAPTKVEIDEKSHGISDKENKIHNLRALPNPLGLKAVPSVAAYSPKVQTKQLQAVFQNGAAVPASKQALMVVDKTQEGIQTQILDIVQFVPLKSGTV